MHRTLVKCECEDVRTVIYDLSGLLGMAFHNCREADEIHTLEEQDMFH